MEVKSTATGLEVYVDGTFVTAVDSWKDWETIRGDLSDDLIAAVLPVCVERFGARETEDWEVVHSQTNCVRAPGCKTTWSWPPDKVEQYASTYLGSWKTRLCGTFTYEDNTLYQNSTPIAWIADQVTLLVEFRKSTRKIQLPKDSDLLQQLCDHKSLCSRPSVFGRSKPRETIKLYSFALASLSAALTKSGIDLITTGKPIL